MGKLGFVNKRAEWWWKLREALDPHGGDELALPPDRELLAELTAPTWRLRMNGIQIESKDDIVARLQRSPDKGESLVYAASVSFFPCEGLFRFYAASAETAAKAAQAHPETIRLRVPQGIGGCTLIDGRAIDADAEGIIAVPPDHVNRLLLAGFSRAESFARILLRQPDKWGDMSPIHHPRPAHAPSSSNRVRRSPSFEGPAVSRRQCAR